MGQKICLSYKMKKQNKSTTLGGHFKHRNHQQKAQKCRKCGPKQTSKMTFIYNLRAEKRRVSIALFNLDWNMPVSPCVKTTQK